MLFKDKTINHKIPIGNRLKVLIPGYRRNWHNRFVILLEQVKTLIPGITFGGTALQPWIEMDDSKYRFYGFPSMTPEVIQAHLLGKYFPKDLPIEYYRVVKDYITRYIYPHMRPDLTPKGLCLNNSAGFHGQHKDSFKDYFGEKKDKVFSAFYPKVDDIIINGGAFNGFGDLQMSQVVSKGHIYSFEADKTCYKLLEKNLDYNEINNVTPLYRGLWNVETTIKLNSGPAQANTIVSEVYKSDNQQEIQTVTIDGMVKEYNIHKLDMISLTINGAEIEALQGAEQAII